MELNNIKESFEHVVKKRKLSSTRCLEVVDTISHELEQALSRVQSDQDLTLSVDPMSVLKELKSKLNNFGVGKELETSEKDMNSNLSKHLKLLEKVLIPDVSKGFKNIDFDVQTVNQIVTDHFFCQGLFDIGDYIMKEAKIPEAYVLRTQLYEMYQIVEALRAKNIQPALKWASENREKIRKNGSNLELQLHQVQYVELLRQGSTNDALKYARANFGHLATSNMAMFLKLMGCLCWIGRLEKYPYLEVLAPKNWEQLADELSQQFCLVIGRSCRPLLTVAIEAGSEALPTLLKYMNLMAGKTLDWQGMEELPFPVELSKGFQFHSTFICPVSRDQSTGENPPMLLPCGHVLCQQSIIKMYKYNSSFFKCPYCPFDYEVNQCKRLFF